MSLSYSKASPKHFRINDGKQRSSLMATLCVFPLYLFANLPTPANFSVLLLPASLFRQTPNSAQLSFTFRGEFPLWYTQAASPQPLHQHVWLTGGVRTVWAFNLHLCIVSMPTDPCCAHKSSSTLSVWSNQTQPLWKKTLVNKPLMWSLRAPLQVKNIKHSGNLSIDDIIDIARTMRPRS